MAFSFSLTLLLVACITTAGLHLISAAKTPQLTQLPSLPPPPVSTTHTPPPPPTQAEIQQNQLDNIIDALMGAGDFTGWAGLLSFTNLSFLTLNATFFVPSNDAVSHFPATSTAALNFDPFLIPYHIVPRRLTFSDLQQFTIRTRLPTLLPYKSIVITNNSPSNFTVDDSQITEADVIVNAAFSVHGVKKILEYSVYGGNGFLPLQPQHRIPLRPKHRNGSGRNGSPNRDCPGESPVSQRSGASSSWGVLLMIFGIFGIVFVLNIV